MGILPELIRNIMLKVCFGGVDEHKDDVVASTSCDQRHALASLYKHAAGAGVDWMDV